MNTNKMQNEIVKALGIDLLTPSEQQEVMARVGGMIVSRVMERAMDVLTEGDQEEFEKMLDAGQDPDKLFEFLAGKIPNLMEIISEETEKVKKEGEDMLKSYGL